MRGLPGYKACAEREISTRHVDILDGVRVLAIFIVAWFHIWQQSWLRPFIYDAAAHKAYLNAEPMVRSGYIMVDLMLLMSGFLLFLPYARHMIEGEAMPRAREFYVKRALRILPSYWLCIAVLLFCFALPAHGWRMDKWLRLDLITHLTFTHVFNGHTYVGTELNVVLWTLAIEVQFYLIFPLIARLFTKKPLLTWVVMVAAGLAFRHLIVLKQPDTTLWVNQLPAFLDVYANGMLSAIFYVHLARAVKHNRWTRLAGTALALVLLAAIWQVILRQASASTHEMIRVYQAQHRFMFSAYCCMFILAAAHASAGLRYLLSNKVMRILSAISFQYYIWHQFLAAKMHNDWRFPPSRSLEPHVDGEQPWQWLFTLCAFGFPLILSLILTYGFEQPIAKAGWKAYKKRKQSKQSRQSSKSKQPERMEAPNEGSENGTAGT